MKKVLFFVSPLDKFTNSLIVMDMVHSFIPVET